MISIGSGKTATISILIQILIALNQRVLVVSNTNFAVNGVLGRLLSDVPGLHTQVIRVTPFRSQERFEFNQQKRTPRGSQQESTGSPCGAPNVPSQQSQSQDTSSDASGIETVSLSSLVQSYRHEFARSAYFSDKFSSSSSLSSSPPPQLSPSLAALNSSPPHTPQTHAHAQSMALPILEHDCYPSLPIPSQLSNTASRLITRPVVCSTIASLSSSTADIISLSQQQFDVVIIDEASQLTIPQTIQAFQRLNAFGRCILIGDTQQLPPLVVNPACMLPTPYRYPPYPLHSLPPHATSHRSGAVRRNLLDGLQVGFMEIASALFPFSVSYIRSQYRMNEEILALPNALFYNHRLQCADTRTAGKRLQISVDPHQPQSILWVQASLVPPEDHQHGPSSEPVSTPVMKRKHPPPIDKRQSSGNPHSLSDGPIGAKKPRLGSDSPTRSTGGTQPASLSPSLGNHHPNTHTPPPTSSSPFLPIFDPKHPLVFLNVDSPSAPSLQPSTHLSPLPSPSSCDFSFLPLPCRHPPGALVNIHEAIVTLTTTLSFLASGVPPSDIVVLSPYKDQVRFISLLFLHVSTTSFSDRVELLPGDHARFRSIADITPSLSMVRVYTIDQSQGLDVEVVLISTVISDLPSPCSPPSLGAKDPSPLLDDHQQPPNAPSRRGKLLEDRQRVNVALTRARNKLIIIGKITAFLIVDPSPPSSSSSSLSSSHHPVHYNYRLPSHPTIFSEAVFFISQHGSVVDIPHDYTTTPLWLHFYLWADMTSLGSPPTRTGNG